MSVDIRRPATSTAVPTRLGVRLAVCVTTLPLMLADFAIALIHRRRLLATIATVGASGLLASASVAALPPGCSQSGQTVTCSYTSGSNPFLVPPGVSLLHVLAVGGSGGGSGGGHGAMVSGDLKVNAGSTLYAVVGGNGVLGAPGAPGSAGGGGPGGVPNFCVFNPSLCAMFPPGPAGLTGGDGGGASDVRSVPADLSSRLLIAAGGGGAGSAGSPANGGRSPGGAGGGGNGASGGTGAAGTLDGGGGGGGSSSSGGAGGALGTAFCLSRCSPGTSGDSGARGLGGDGGNGGGALLTSSIVFGGPGGGGGGGLFGGGGGAGGSGGADGGGGGGGSNLVPPGGTQSTDTTGTPMVQISYLPVPASKAQCKNGGWRNYPQFKNQGQCVSFVETGK